MKSMAALALGACVSMSGEGARGDPQKPQSWNIEGWEVSPAPKAVEPDSPDRFIALSQFQVWADAANPDVFRKLNKLFIENGRSHVGDLAGKDNFVWDLDRMKGWAEFPRPGSRVVGFKSGVGTLPRSSG